MSTAVVDRLDSQVYIWMNQIPWYETRLHRAQNQLVFNQVMILKQTCDRVAEWIREDDTHQLQMLKALRDWIKHNHAGYAGSFSTNSDGERFWRWSGWWREFFSVANSAIDQAELEQRQQARQASMEAINNATAQMANAAGAASRTIQSTWNAYVDADTFDTISFEPWVIGNGVRNSFEAVDIGSLRRNIGIAGN